MKEEKELMPVEVQITHQQYADLFTATLEVGEKAGLKPKEWAIVLSEISREVSEHMGIHHIMHHTETETIQ